MLRLPQQQLCGNVSDFVWFSCMCGNYGAGMLIPEAHFRLPLAGIGNTAQRLKFQTLSGELTVEKQASGLLAMDFPLNEPTPSTPEDVRLESPFIQAIVTDTGVAVKELLWNSGLGKALVVLQGDKEDLLRLGPDFRQLLAAKKGGILGVIVTCKGKRIWSIFI